MSIEPPAGTVRAGQQHTVTIEKLTYGGAGLAHIAELAVFVPGTVPGQQVEITTGRSVSRKTSSARHSRT